MRNSPAEILRALLVQEELGVLPTEATTGDWCVYVGHLADEPDNAICAYDVGGRKTGRVQRTGETLVKPGWQIRVRDMSYNTGYAKINEICDFLDEVKMSSVQIDGNKYKVQVITQVGTVLSLGREPEGTKRENFTVNGTITYTVE